MKKVWTALAALTLLGCSQPAATENRTAQTRTAAPDWCVEFYNRFNRNGGFSPYVDQRTGRLSQDIEAGVIYYPRTNRVAFSSEETACIRREAQKAIDAYEGTKDRSGDGATQ
jgi:hypothetical protein